MRRLPPRIASCISAIALATFAAVPVQAQTENFPSRALRLVVPFPAGGPTDAISRLAAEQLAPVLGHSVVVMNKAGAAGGIASEFVANEAADGHTLLVAGQGQMFINKALGKKMAYDPDTDFKFVGMLGAFPNVVVVNPDVIAARSMKAFVALAAKEPGKFAYGSNGIGSLAHLTTEVIASSAGVSFLHVPYQGAAPQMTDLLSGRIGFSVLGAQSVIPHIKEGKLVPLAVSTGSRFAGLPDTPTLIESGFAALDAPVWFGVFVRSDTPDKVLTALRQAMGKVLASGDYQAGLAQKSAQPLIVPVDAADARLAKEKRMWVDAVERTGAAKQ